MPTEAEAELELRRPELWQQHPDPAIERAKQAVKAEPQTEIDGTPWGFRSLTPGNACIARSLKVYSTRRRPEMIFMAMDQWQRTTRKEQMVLQIHRWIDDAHGGLRRRRAEPQPPGLPDPWDRSEEASACLKQGNNYQQQEK
jgi:hypothetical protein